MSCLCSPRRQSLAEVVVVTDDDASSRPSDAPPARTAAARAPPSSLSAHHRPTRTSSSREVRVVRSMGLRKGRGGRAAAAAGSDRPSSRSSPPTSRTTSRNGSSKLMLKGVPPAGSVPAGLEPEEDAEAASSAPSSSSSSSARAGAAAGASNGIGPSPTTAGGASVGTSTAAFTTSTAALTAASGGSGSVSRGGPSSPSLASSAAPTSESLPQHGPDRRQPPSSSEAASTTTASSRASSGASSDRRCAGRTTDPADRPGSGRPTQLPPGETSADAPSKAPSASTASMSTTSIPTRKQNLRPPPPSSGENANPPTTDESETTTLPTHPPIPIEQRPILRPTKSSKKSFVRPGQTLPPPYDYRPLNHGTEETVPLRCDYPPGPSLRCLDLVLGGGHGGTGWYDTRPLAVPTVGTVRRRTFVAPPGQRVQAGDPPTTTGSPPSGGRPAAPSSSIERRIAVRVQNLRRGRPIRRTVGLSTLWHWDFPPSWVYDASPSSVGWVDCSGPARLRLYASSVSVNSAAAGAGAGGVGLEGEVWHLVRMGVPGAAVGFGGLFPFDDYAREEEEDGIWEMCGEFDDDDDWDAGPWFEPVPHEFADFGGVEAREAFGPRHDRAKAGAGAEEGDADGRPGGDGGGEADLPEFAGEGAAAVASAEVTSASASTAPPDAPDGPQDRRQPPARSGPEEEGVVPPATAVLIRPSEEQVRRARQIHDEARRRAREEVRGHVVGGGTFDWAKGGGGGGGPSDGREGEDGLLGIGGIREIAVLGDNDNVSTMSEDDCLSLRPVSSADGVAAALSRLAEAIEKCGGGEQQRGREGEVEGEGEAAGVADAEESAAAEEAAEVSSEEVSATRRGDVAVAIAIEQGSDASSDEVADMLARADSNRSGNGSGAAAADLGVGVAAAPAEHEVTTAAASADRSPSPLPTSPLAAALPALDEDGLEEDSREDSSDDLLFGLVRGGMVEEEEEEICASVSSGYVSGDGDDSCDGSEDDAGDDNAADEYYDERPIAPKAVFVHDEDSIREDAVARSVFCDVPASGDDGDGSEEIAVQGQCRHQDQDKAQAKNQAQPHKTSPPSGGICARKSVSWDESSIVPSEQSKLVVTVEETEVEPASNSSGRAEEGSSAVAQSADDPASTIGHQSSSGAVSSMSEKTELMALEGDRVSIPPEEVEDEDEGEEEVVPADVETERRPPSLTVLMQSDSGLTTVLESPSGEQSTTSASREVLSVDSGTGPAAVVVGDESTRPGDGTRTVNDDPAADAATNAAAVVANTAALSRRKSNIPPPPSKRNKMVPPIAPATRKSNIPPPPTRKKNMVSPVTSATRKSSLVLIGPTVGDGAPPKVHGCGDSIRTLETECSTHPSDDGSSAVPSPDLSAGAAGKSTVGWDARSRRRALEAQLRRQRQEGLKSPPPSDVVSIPGPAKVRAKAGSSARSLEVAILKSLRERIDKSIQTTDVADEKGAVDVGAMMQRLNSERDRMQSRSRLLRRVGLEEGASN